MTSHENTWFGGSGVEGKIEALNQILSLEYAAFHQYTQHSFLVHGLDRPDFKEFFEEQAESSYKHAATTGYWSLPAGNRPQYSPGFPGLHEHQRPDHRTTV